MKSYSVWHVYSGTNAEVAKALNGKPLVIGNVRAATERKALNLARKIYGPKVTVTAD